MEDIKKMQNETEELTFKYRELVKVGKFYNNPPHYLNKVIESDERLILTRNGSPVAGLVPLWMLLAVEKAVTTGCSGTSADCTSKKSGGEHGSGSSGTSCSTSDSREVTDVGNHDNNINIGDDADAK